MKTVNKPMYVCEYCGKQSYNPKEIEECEKRHSDYKNKYKEMLEKQKKKLEDGKKIEKMIEDYEKTYRTKFKQSKQGKYDSSEINMLVNDGCRHYYRGNHEITEEEFNNYLEEFFG